MSNDEIGKKIMERRKALGLTLEAVGNAVGVGKSTVRKWENGMIKNMRRDKIAALASVLQMDPVEFVPGTSTKPQMPYVKVNAPKKSFVEAMVKASVKEPNATFEYTPKGAIPVIKQLDQQTKSMMKLWEVSTPETRTAVLGVLKAMNKPTKKEGKT